MSKYPPQSCRNCIFATWRWSKKKYSDKRYRIIVQTEAKCLADPGAGPKAGRGMQIDAKTPLIGCEAWKFHGDPEKAQR